MKIKLIALAAAITLLATVGLTAVSQADTDTQAPTAAMTATDEMTVGTNRSSTIVGTQLAEVSDDTAVTKIEYYLNDALMATNSKPGDKDGISLETKDYKNGTYYLTVKLYDAAGNVGRAKTMLGKDRLTFHVDNKAATPAPAPTPPSASTQTASACKGKQADIDRITKRIVDRYEQQYDDLKEIEDKVTAYHSAQSSKLDDFDSHMSEIDEKAEVTESAVAALSGNAGLACDAQYQASLDKFKSANMLVMEKVRDYRLGLLELVTELEEL